MEAIAESAQQGEFFDLELNTGECDLVAAELESPKDQRRSIGTRLLASHAERRGANPRVDARAVVLGVIAFAQMLMLVYFTVGQP